MITHRTLGPIFDIPSMQRAMRDLESERQQIVAALNLMLVNAPAGEFRVILIDDTGTPAQYVLVAGAGVTITIDDALKTVTFTSP